VAQELFIFPLTGIRDVVAGDDLVQLIVDAARSQTGDQRAIQRGDVFVVAQKIVSKAENAVVRLDDVVPSTLAREWGTANGKDPRVVEIILRESRRIVRMDLGVLISETHQGFVCANAGVDASNVPKGWVTLLPRDPDASASRLSEGLSQAFGTPVSVIVADTFGRPWREGVVNVALGVAGLQPLIDYRGWADHYGRRLESTVVGLADEIASAAEIVMRKIARIPVAVVRGAAEWAGPGSGRMFLRDGSRDLFR
jgi:coenzyme F420-0:L-glutamate ligase / coenzyme F420-1:gamma-L-glutamate ligase